ncbi:MAG: hypothetical protein A2156_10600 [Deltaproteobacteria bacterium RBG_16_48_10]|nr:MAG: hypothetical protein A2156_10600 [Deltaproteobacteria bacterium RBG_16_48_10]
MLNAQMVEDPIPLIREAVKRMKKVAVIIRTGGIEHAAIRRGNLGVFVVPPGVSSVPFGVYFEASIERRGNSRFLAPPTNPTGVFLL